MKGRGRGGHGGCCHAQRSCPWPQDFYLVQLRLAQSAQMEVGEDHG